MEDLFHLLEAQEQAPTQAPTQAVVDPKLVEQPQQQNEMLKTQLENQQKGLDDHKHQHQQLIECIDAMDEWKDQLDGAHSEDIIYDEIYALKQRFDQQLVLTSDSSKLGQGTGDLGRGNEKARLGASVKQSDPDEKKLHTYPKQRKPYLLLLHFDLVNVF
jgi:small-conductance mechanosensitive channel